MADRAPHRQWELGVQRARAWDLRAEQAGQMVRVLANSLEEFWEEAGDLDLPRRMALQAMSRTPHLAWMVLTARPEAILGLLQTTLGQTWDDASLPAAEREAFAGWIEAWLGGKPPANVWLGTIMGQAAGADGRIKALLQVPAKVRFLSCNLGCPKMVASATTQASGPRPGRKVRRQQFHGPPATRMLGRSGGWVRAGRGAGAALGSIP